MRPPKDPTLAATSTLAWWTCPGVVYFLGVGTPLAAIKIGMLAVTGKLTLQAAMARRVGQMQTSNHEPIQVLGIIVFNEGQFPTRAAEARERELHNKYAHLARFKSETKGSEWFNCSEELLDEIRSICSKPADLAVRSVYATLSSERTEP